MQERRIDVLNYQIEGNSVLSRKEVEAAVMPYLGHQRLVSDVDEARKALLAAYQEKGFETVNVVIPAQDVRNGVVRLKVVEMKIGRLRVDGADYYSPEDIRERVPSLREGGVPNYNAVSKELAAVNKSADRLVTPTLRAGLEPGTVDVDLMVDDKLPLHGSIEVNDRASSNTKRYKVAASISYGNLFQREHSMNLQAQMSPEAPGESWVVSASYVAPLGKLPLTLVGYAVHTDSDVSAIGDINVLGKGNILGLRTIYSKVTGDPISPRIHQFTFGIDYKDFEESLFSENNPSYTPISYMPVSIGYSQAKRGTSYDMDLGLTAVFGVRGLAADDAEFGIKRFNAKANWSVVRANASYKYKFDSDWHVSAGIAGQWAGEPVISNEQFSIGGVQSVRGYYESFQLGDDGLSGQLQIDSPSFHGVTNGLIDELRLYTFSDAGYVRIYNPLSVQDSAAELVSVGGGIRLRALSGLNANVSIAKPFHRENSTLLDIGDEFRIQFRVWNEF
ncbi:ShlB/FhaC/HecB family hemolysin secretion/activation protein [Hyphococcus formosus]|uniref:ShlB/FhaC/HecB family hemolysin secretion/activation protein n=1 Tax=Hyphococcus formosus TaxID=3143534 RepID=UPI00398A6F65